MWEGENVITRASYANNGCSILYKNHRKLSVATLLQFMLGIIMLSLGISIRKLNSNLFLSWTDRDSKTET